MVQTKEERARKKREYDREYKKRSEVRKRAIERSRIYEQKPERKARKKITEK